MSFGDLWRVAVHALVRGGVYRLWGHWPVIAVVALALVVIAAVVHTVRRRR